MDEAQTSSDGTFDSRGVSTKDCVVKMCVYILNASSVTPLSAMQGLRQPLL